MTAGSPDVLVLAVGNELLSDDAAGLHILRSLPPAEGVEYMDGGTKGLELLGEISGRRALLILDAVKMGGEPGALHYLRPGDLRAHRATTAHEGNALELLAVAELTGDLPGEVLILGVEPEDLHTGWGLSASVEASIPLAVSRATQIIDHLRSATDLDAAYMPDGGSCAAKG